MAFKDSPFFSVIIPAKNEEALLGSCLESLAKLDYPKEQFEIIIADGLSADGTKEIALRHGAKVVDNEKQVVVSGRNIGFEAARGDFIAFSDADCVFDDKWLRNSIKYFNDDKVAGIGGMSLAPQDSTSFEKAVNFLFGLAEAFGTTAHRQNPDAGIKRVNDIPGCNAMYRRQALERVMPVDENLLTAEDVWMNFRLRRLGYEFIFAPDVTLWHYRRSSPGRFLRQVYRFAVGRLQVGKRSLKLINVFHIIAGFSLPIIIFFAVFSYMHGALGLFFKASFAFLAACFLSTLLSTKSLPAALYAPLAAVLFIFGWSAGFLRELSFPLKDVRGK